jgi:hypothetical protein
LQQSDCAAFLNKEREAEEEGSKTIDGRGNEGEVGVMAAGYLMDMGKQQHVGISFFICELALAFYLYIYARDRQSKKERRQRDKSLGKCKRTRPNQTVRHTAQHSTAQRRRSRHGPIRALTRVTSASHTSHRFA